MPNVTADPVREDSSENVFDHYLAVLMRHNHWRSLCSSIALACRPIIAILLIKAGVTTLTCSALCYAPLRRA
jgi:hypothetical protein